jgi:hypothetical protein
MTCVLVYFQALLAFLLGSRRGGHCHDMFIRETLRHFCYEAQVLHFAWNPIPFVTSSVTYTSFRVNC